MRPPHLYSVNLDNFAFFYLSCCFRDSLYDSVATSSPVGRFTVRHENEHDCLVPAESHDSEEATLSGTREAERLISSRTVCRIMHPSRNWVCKYGRLEDNMQNT